MISGANSSDAPTIFGSLTISRQNVLLKVMQDIFFLALFLRLQHLTKCCFLNISVYCVLFTV